MSLSSPMNKDLEPDPSGRDRPSTIYAYDLLNRLTSITDPLGRQSIPDGDAVSNQEPIRSVTTYIHDFPSQTTVVVDPLGNRTTMSLEAALDEDPMSPGTRIGEHGRGWLDTSAGGDATTYSYPPTTPAAGEATPTPWEVHGAPTLATYHYDDHLRLVAYTDQNGNMTSYAHDSEDEGVARSRPL